MNEPAPAIKEVIEKMVNQEIRNILAHSKDIIRKGIKDQLIPELRAAIRDLISETMKEAAEPAEIPQATRTEPTDEIPIPAASQEGVQTEETEPKPVVPSEERVETEKAEPKPVVPPETDTRGRYVYCVGESNERINLGKIGIDNSQVYTIPYKDVCAVVHDCPTQPYESKDTKVVEGWVITHEETIETAWKKLGAVLPFGFDTIIKGDEEEEEDAEEVVKAWLKEDYEGLKEKLNKVRGKVEYGVQISWDTKIITSELIKKDPELKKLNEEIKSKPKGVAYMYKQKLEKLIRGKLEKEGEKRFKEFYEMIKGCTDEVKVEKLKKEDEPRQMLMNLSCLADKDHKTLGDELEKIKNKEGFFVRFTGPWPPYSFV